MEATFGRGMITEDGTNVLFETANRNKKSITLDLKKDEGKEILHKLVAKSDVFCTNYSLPAIRTLDLGYETLTKYNSKLVYGLATGYGSVGPDSEKRAFDAIAQARSGIMTAVGEPESPPMQITGVLFDQVTGTIMASGIMAALIACQKQGIGQLVEVSLLGCGIHMQAFNANVTMLRGRPMPKASRKTMKNPLANHYECADGKWILLCEAQSDRFWHPFCTAMGLQSIEGDPKYTNAQNRRHNFLELTATLEKTFITKPRDEWLALLEAKGEGMAFSPIHDLSELTSDPQVMLNDYIIEVDHPTMGKVKMTGFPMKFNKTPAKVTKTAPMFGQHTEEVLMDLLGYDWAGLEKLRTDEVI